MGTRRRPDDPVHLPGRLRRVRVRHRTGRGRRAPRPRPAGRRSRRRRSPTWPPTRPPTYARRDDDAHYLVDRVCRTTSYEIVNDGTPAVFALRDAVLAGPTGGDGVSLRVIGHTRTFYDGEAFVGLPLGELGEHGLPVRTESLAFTDDFLDSLYAGGDPLTVSPRPPYLAPGPVSWPTEYPTEFRDLTPALAGYRHYTDADVPGSPGGYYIVGGAAPLRRARPGTVPRGLPVESLDPLGASRPGSTTTRTICCRSGPIDAAGLETAGGQRLPRAAAARAHRPERQHHLGHLLPRRLGHRPVRARQGRRGRRDRPERADDLRPAGVRRARPAGLGDQHPTGAPRHRRRRRGRSARRRDRVASSSPTGSAACCRPGPRPRTPCSATRSSAAASSRPTRLAPVGDTAGRTREPGRPGQRVVSGWQIYDNKGRVVREVRAVLRAPASTTPSPSMPQLGQKATIFYDPRGQVDPHRQPGRQRAAGRPRGAGRPGRSRRVRADGVGVLHLRRQRQRRPHPPRDSRPRTRTTGTPRPASRSTPLGRTVAAVARNGTDHDASLVHHPLDLRHPGQPDLDHRRPGPRGVPVPLRPGQAPLADGQHRRRAPRHRVRTPLGNPVEGRDSKGAFTLGAFDVLHRPIRVWARDDGTRPGDAAPADRLRRRRRPRPTRRRPRRGPRPQPARPRRRPLRRGRACVTVAAVDFKGNVLESARRVIADAPILATYDRRRRRTAGRSTPFQVDWTPDPAQTQAERDAELLEPAATRTTTTLRRAQPGHHGTSFRTDVEGQRRELQPALQPRRRPGAGPPRRHPLRRAHRLRRQGPAHPDRLRQRRDDPLRLRPAAPSGSTRLRSEHYTLDGDHLPADRRGRCRTTATTTTSSATSSPSATAPPAAASPTTRTPSRPPTRPSARCSVSGDALDRRFTYDPIYRLLTRDRPRMRRAAQRRPVDRPPRGTDITRARAYTETYRYDAARQPAAPRPQRRTRRLHPRLHRRRGQQPAAADDSRHDTATTTPSTPTAT